MLTNEILVQKWPPLTVKAFRPRNCVPVLGGCLAIEFMGGKSKGQRDWMELYFYYCGRTIGAARHYLFRVSDGFAARWLEQLNCLPVDCGHWFGSLRCAGLFSHRLDCVQQEVAGKEEASGRRARGGWKVSVAAVTSCISAAGGEGHLLRGPVGLRQRDACRWGWDSHMSQVRRTALAVKPDDSERNNAWPFCIVFSLSSFIKKCFCYKSRSRFNSISSRVYSGGRARGMFSGFFFPPTSPFLSLFLVTEHSNEKGCGGAVSRPCMWAATSICSRPLRLLTDGPEREVTVLHLQLF